MSTHFRLYLDRRHSKSILAPVIVASHRQLDAVVLRIAEILTGAPVKNRREFLGAVYYLLGMVRGRSGKNYGAESRLSSRIVVQRTKKHPENLEVGEYVVEIVRGLGIWCKRYKDRTTSTSNPNGSFHWKSAFSPVIGWFHSAALGLKWEERTTTDPVKMERMTTAPRLLRVWFLRGVADSDGFVNLRNKEVETVSSPNTPCFFIVCSPTSESRTWSEFSRGYGLVTLSAPVAENIQLFGGAVPTQRSKILGRLVGATTFQRH